MSDEIPLATLVLIAETVNKFITFESNYKTILREVGLVDMLLACLHKYSVTTGNDGMMSVAKFASVVDALILLIRDCPENIIILRQSYPRFNFLFSFVLFIYLFIYLFFVLFSQRKKLLTSFVYSGCCKMLLASVRDDSRRKAALKLLRALVNQDKEQVYGYDLCLCTNIKYPQPSNKQ